jgi:hypothetical protein
LTRHDMATANPRPHARAKLGGDTTLVVLLQASQDVLDSLLPIETKGRELQRGLAARVEELTHGSTAVKVRRASAETAEGLLEELRSNQAALADVDVIVLSVASEVSPSGSAAEVAHRYEGVMEQLIGLARERGVPVIAFNASSFDPDDTISCYAGAADTPVLFIQQLNRSLIRLSMLDGISIIDADRIMAEIGGRSHVERLLSYSPHACDLLCQELVRVMDDYGFFEDRPLLAQVGQRDR